MGLDVYMRWKGQTDEEKEAQYTGYSTVHGHVGYLREAYHGGPYATKALVGDAFDEDKQITAAELRARLPKTLKVVAERERKLYKGTDEDVALVQKSYIDFVELAERKEAETGEPVTIHVS